MTVVDSYQEWTVGSDAVLFLYCPVIIVFIFNFYSLISLFVLYNVGIIFAIYIVLDNGSFAYKASTFGCFFLNRNENKTI